MSACTYSSHSTDGAGNIVSCTPSYVVSCGSFCAGSCFCFHDALTFNGTGYRGTDFIEGFSYWPDFFARVFLGYLLYDLVIMLAFR